MVEFFRNLSKHTLAFIIIGVGILLIVASDPPVTVCGQQIKAFEKAEIGNLVKDPKESFRKESRFKKVLSVCRRANSIGGCYEFFNGIRWVF